MTMINTKIIYATVKLLVEDVADVDDITDETEYNFSHPLILKTDWIRTEEKADES